jgi:hypothetical protein
LYLSLFSLEAYTSCLATLDVDLSPANCGSPFGNFISGIQLILPAFVVDEGAKACPSPKSILLHFLAYNAFSAVLFTVTGNSQIINEVARRIHPFFDPENALASDGRNASWLKRKLYDHFRKDHQQSNWFIIP